MSTYELQVSDHTGWTDVFTIDEDLDDAAETQAIQWILDERPDEGTEFRLIRVCGEVTIGYVEPPPPPEPELEQLSFG